MGAKAQLHFILFGVFSLIGVVLLAMAIMGKSGAAKSLDEAKAKLEAAAKPPIATQGDLDAARQRQTAFQKEISGFETKLRNETGERLRIFEKEYTNKDQFYASEWTPKSGDFKTRLKAIRKDPVPPALLRKSGDENNPNPNGKEFTNIPDPDKFWIELDRTMNSLPDKDIPNAQSQIKVMAESIAVMEKLRASDLYKDQPFVFERFDFQGFAGEAAKEVNIPWTRREFGVIMWCDPTFALAFAEEMCCPSEKTKGEDSDKTRRQFLPMELASIGAEMVGRPHDVLYFISNADREKHGIGPTQTLDDLSDTKKREIEESLAGEAMLVMPLRYVIRLQALQLNREWVAVKVAGQ
ncbi:MAG: hypothetical protein IT462_10925 [Planctomycetes bacterium]|nr:hypothetical protein [Planctomycetota bacterium]